MSRPHADESAFRALADPTRRRIIELLRKSEGPAGELAHDLRIQMPAMSHHLGILRSAGIIHQHRRGRHRMYKLQPASIIAAKRWLQRMA